MGALFAVASVYWGSGLGTNPAWNTWVGTIVPMRLRARYFARRTRFSQIGVLAGFILAGVGLQYGQRVGQLLDVFGFVFLAAGLCRLASAAFHCQPERAGAAGTTIIAACRWASSSGGFTSAARGGCWSIC